MYYVPLNCILQNSEFYVNFTLIQTSEKQNKTKQQNDVAHSTKDGYNHQNLKT